ncbi:MAG: ATP-binding protein [Gammaproteobacteria bacterium]|nr:ATP-binding protein [Gammaproteobacteria bacterium]
MKQTSLRVRLLSAFALILLLILGGTIWVLDRNFISSSSASVASEMQANLHALMFALENPRGRGMYISRFAEPRLFREDSGLFAFILDGWNREIWRSMSASEFNLTEYLPKKTSMKVDVIRSGDNLDSSFIASLTVGWIRFGISQDITLVLVDDASEHVERIYDFRWTLFKTLGLTGLVLLLVQVVSLFWGLSPLRQVSRELDQIEHAHQEKIMGQYPDEIAQLSTRINLFIENERKNLTRYRNALADLAHSLKTPLAEIIIMVGSKESPDQNRLEELTHDMNSIVEYQLKRASSSEFSVIHKAVEVEKILRRLEQSLCKIYADRGLDIQFELEQGVEFYGDEGDLFELLGNVLENAFKWANRVILCRTSSIRKSNVVHEGLIIEIHDDGPGINPNDREDILKRGVRLDERASGQGIGLSLVNEIVERYSGTLDISSSSLGGVLLTIKFPAQ